jgi:hypothetical protein
MKLSFVWQVGQQVSSTLISKLMRKVRDRPLSSCSGYFTDFLGICILKHPYMKKSVYWSTTISPPHLLPNKIGKFFPVSQYLLLAYNCLIFVPIALLLFLYLKFSLIFFALSFTFTLFIFPLFDIFPEINTRACIKNTGMC